MHLVEGQIIRADFLKSPARVKKFEERSAFYLVEVTLEGSGEYRSLRLTREQLAQIEVTDTDPSTIGSDPESFFLTIEATRIRLAHQFDPMLAVGVSQVDPLPHQIEAVYDYALTSPRLRFLIADDPGAGKTIMAGLIIKEMQYRKLAGRVLIVVPGHLKPQWQREMKEKFNLGFRIIDRNTIRAAWGENVWEENPLTVTSLDFLRQEDVKATIQSTRWDLIIVDEAHKMSAYAYQSKERTRIDKTKRYMVGEILSRQGEHLLFLTATPHSGDEERFRLFLDLLRPGFFAKSEYLRESVERKDNPLFVRRLKEDMKKFNGQPIFPPRTVRTVTFKMTDAEIELYNNVTRFVQDYFNRAKENRNVAFALMILQRRLTSSVRAILSSLERRRDRLQDLLRLPEKLRSDERFQELRKLDEEELEDLSERERWEVEEKLEQLTIAENIEDVKVEIQQIEGLIKDARTVQAQETESKLVRLRDEILSSLGSRKLLIFTEHKDTLWYLVEKLKAWGYDVNFIHGGMDLDSRIEAERVFRERTQVMVATEAAGEGINLQFCSLMVNYDIPWNPNRLEQRMGRVHRYLQKNEVLIWNLVSKDTREGQVLNLLFQKLEKMREELGTDRVFDVIGEVIPGTNLNELLKESIFGQRRMDEIADEIDQVNVEHTIQTMERLAMSALATRHIDYTSIERKTYEAEENRLVPEYVGDFTLRALLRFGGKYTATQLGYRIDAVPFEIRKVNDDYAFKSAYGLVQREYRRVTFDKKIARDHPEYEFVAPGHPLLEALNDAIFRELRGEGSQYAVFRDTTGNREGALWFVEGEIRDGLGAPAGRRVFALLQGTDDTVQHVNPDILWNLEQASDETLPSVIADQIKDRSRIEDYFVEEVLFPYRQEIANRRTRDAEIKERYGLRSLDYLIQESNQKLLEYDARATVGEDMDLAIRNERQNLEQLERRREQLKEEIILERNLTVEEPRVIGVAAVVAQPPASDPEGEEGQDTGRGSRERMARDEECERVGMQVAIDHEELLGWQVEDVSRESHGGFDLRSTRVREDGGLEVRYIEVKARSRTGSVELTANEWKRARHFGDSYFLYIVTDARTNEPKLQRIQNPAALFKEGEDIFATRLRIPEENWRQHAVTPQEGKR